MTQIWPALRDRSGTTRQAPVLGGLAVGIVAMYLTSLLVPA
jgi:hypothetical protein